MFGMGDDRDGKVESETEVTDAVGSGKCVPVVSCWFCCCELSVVDCVEKETIHCCDD